MKYPILILVAIVSFSVKTAAAHPISKPNTDIKHGECFYVLLDSISASEPCEIKVKQREYGKNTMIQMSLKNFNVVSFVDKNGYLNHSYNLNSLPAKYYLRDSKSRAITTERVLEINKGTPIFCYQSIISNVCHN